MGLKPNMRNLHKYQKFFQFLVLVILYVWGINLFLYLKMLGFTELKSAPPELQKGMLSFFGFITFIIAFIIGLLELKLFNRWNRYSALKFVLYKYITIIIVILSVAAVVFCLSVMAYQKVPFSTATKAVPGFFKSELFFSVFVFLLLFSMIFNVLKTISEHLGPQAFWAALLGRYNSPLEEDRTFIFLDMNSSTTIAEKIGHAQYSLFINECFQILTRYMYKYGAVLYQFVGDEAVLSWKTSAAKKTLAPLQLYFDFSEHLRKENEKLNTEYGASAKFKATIHAGLVTVTKIQSTKNEIVYHGDVLNTCARMMEQCGRLKKELLVSQPITEWLTNNTTYKVNFIEQLTLRGKEQETPVYEVNKVSERSLI